MTYPGSDQNPPEPPTTPSPAAPFAPIVPSQPSYEQPSYEPPAFQPTSAPVFQPTPAPQAYPPQPPQGFPTQPTPMPPTYDPTAAQQFSAPPVSAPYGYGMPMQMSGMPMMQAPPAKRGKGGLITLSILTALFVLATGVMTTLFLQQRGEATKANDLNRTLNGQYNDLKAQSEQLKRDNDNAKRDLTDAKAATDEVTAQKKAVADCVNGIYGFWDELAKSKGAENAATRRKEQEALAKCKTASPYL